MHLLTCNKNCIANILGVFLTVWRLCIATSLNCTLVSKDHFYDLSPLAERDYWSYEEKSKYAKFNLNFYISVCHPLRNVPSGTLCTEQGAAVCVVQLDKNETLPYKERFTKVVTPNAGIITPNSIKLTNEGWLEYVYTNGTPCEYHGRPETYKTYLNFLCPTHGAEESPGPVLMSNTMCELTFAWLTNAACPTKYNDKKVTTCVDKFLDSNEKLNLHALHSLTYYNVISEQKKYQINICGAIETGPCSGKNATTCDVSDPNNPRVLSSMSDMEVMWHGPYFTLHYNGNKTISHQDNSEKEVIVQFLCDRHSHNTTLHFMSESDSQVRFAAQTSAVCTPQDHECIIKDKKGQVYDLRPLHKKDDNWEVLDRRGDHRDVLYHLNLCGPVNEVGYYSCPLGNVGVCQTSMNRQTAYNLGYITSDPVVNTDGTITVIYTGGDPCHEGKHTHSTRLMLVCSQYEHEPKFLEETDMCEYVFSWLTPKACPRHVLHSDTCQIQDPLYGYTYDLQPMRNIIKDYTASDGTHDFYVNICGPVVGEYGVLPAMTAVAMTGTKQLASGGIVPSVLIFNDGTLTMEFGNGSKCDSDDSEKRSTQIIFMCDHEIEDGNKGLSVFRHDSSCKFNFVWRTKYVCPPHTVIDCSLTTKEGFKYDLNPLSMSNMNQEGLGDNHDEKYVLNVCRSVVHSKMARCAYDAAACLIDESHQNKSINIGVVANGPYLDKSILKLQYVNGDQCNATHRFSTEILFECDAENTLPYPTLVAKEDCKFVFKWKTRYACPEKVEPSSYGNCSATDIYTNYLFDLSPLKKSSGYEITNGKVNLVLNVCGKVSDPRCPVGNSGACIKEKDSETFVSAGVFNDELMSTPGTLSLRYSNGNPCSNGLKRTTLISFFCGAENAAEGPVLVAEDESSCTYFVNWHTELACQSRVDCFARGFDRTVDLRPLVNHYSNYEVAYPSGHPGDKFYINVCRPLNHVLDTHCAAGSSACLVHHHNDSSSDSSTDAVSLGKPLIRPNHGFDNTVMLLYTLGSPCDEVPGLYYTTRINFVCDRTALLGSPTFLTFTHDCQYQFEWRTEVACDPLPQADTNDTDPACHVRHDEAKTNIQLGPLYKKNGYRVPYGQTVYFVNVCGAACDNVSAVCTDTDESFGLRDMSQFKWDYGALKLQYYGGDSCASSLSGKKTTTIFFECDMNAGYGVPQPDPMMEALSCMAVFTWRTNITCLQSIYSSSTSTTATTTTIVPREPSSSNPGTNGSKSSSEPISDGGDASSRGGGGGMKTTVAVVMAFMVVTLFAGAVLYAVKTGLAHRLINRAKLATATTRYSSRQGGMMLLDDTL